MWGIGIFPAFMIGMLGSVHCVGMCGGIVGALSIAPAPQPSKARPFPVAVAVAPHSLGKEVCDGVSKAVLYNMGRIASYGMAGAFAGGLAHGARTLVSISSAQTGGYWLANLMLVALGLYVMGIWQGLTKIEAAGLWIWRGLQPLNRYLVPLDSPVKMLAVGCLWGWLPCGMVYSMLLTAMLSGTARGGATIMLAFGFGTVPTMLMLGVLGARLRRWMQQRNVRLVSGLIVLAFGLLGMVRASGGLPGNWFDSVCLTPAFSGVSP